MSKWRWGKKATSIIKHGKKTNKKTQTRKWVNHPSSHWSRCRVNSGQEASLEVIYIDTSTFAHRQTQLLFYFIFSVSVFSKFLQSKMFSQIAGKWILLSVPYYGNWSTAYWFKARKWVAYKLLKLVLAWLCQSYMICWPFYTRKAIQGRFQLKPAMCSL